MENQSLFKEYQGAFKETAEVKSEKKPFEYAYSPFALQDAVGEANVKKIWLEYNKLVLQGIEPEDLVHKIIGKVRDLAAIAKGATAIDLGIKEYPFNKSKKDLKNWPTEKLLDFYAKLVTLYHESRRGGEPLDLALEKALLNL